MRFDFFLSRMDKDQKEIFFRVYQLLNTLILRPNVENLINQYTEPKVKFEIEVNKMKFFFLIFQGFKFDKKFCGFLHRRERESPLFLVSAGERGSLSDSQQTIRRNMGWE